MPKLVCECGAELTIGDRDLPANSGTPITCTNCGRPLKLRPEDVFITAAPPGQIACPHCNWMMEDDANLAGQLVACPGCAEQFQVPGLPKPVRPLAESAIRRGSMPGKVLAVRIMLFVGGFVMFVWGGFMLILLCCVWPMSFVAFVGGVLAFMDAMAMDRQLPTLRAPILQILCVFNLDLVSLILGIVEILFLNNPEVVAYYSDSD